MAAETTKLGVLQEMLTEEEATLAKLRIQVEVQARFVDSLRTKVAECGHSEQTSAGGSSTSQESLAMPERIVRVLQQSAQPMRVTDITAKLEAEGMTTTGAKGLIANVASALARRDDLFVRVDRGLYRLNTGDQNCNGNGSP